MGKRAQPSPFADHPFVDGFFDWMDSPEGELSGVVSDAVCALLQEADVDAKRRKIIWPDGKRLSLAESVQCIHTTCPDFPPELIEEHLIGWLELEFAPPNYSQQQLDELDSLTEKWIEDHERQAENPRKRARTQHS